MRDPVHENNLPKMIHLSDYQKHPFVIDQIDLTFELNPTRTIVTAISQIHHQPPQGGMVQGSDRQDLHLDGEKLELLEIHINNQPISSEHYTIEEDHLQIHHIILPKDSFELKVITAINPQENTELEGLYLSNGMYCTQCEAQGFRRITYYIDRPDNMAEFQVTLISQDPKATPILLSNGNLRSHHVDDQGRLVAQWHDPFKKPCYLFALVAGDLGVVKDKFITKSGREVDLHLYVNHGNQGASYYAMDALKRAMKWDEDVYDLEYDLDLFMIVAVHDFNFGAMENKGLNIFNSKYILAKPDTATDTDYEHIEGVVAHEYFHNWTGNRVTCRDWFQLCLKEGLTVYRDQSFSGDMRSRATKRIDDVITLRLSQFSEDAGPLAHPVRPNQYIEINNFYTATVYEKGAEICRMLNLILGDEAYQKGIKLYFQRFDGMAVTIEDFIQAMADASRVNLSQFLLWYQQPGTPHIDVKGHYDAEKKQYHMTLRQFFKKQFVSDQQPYILDIPILVAFIAQDGSPSSSVFQQSEPQKEHLIRLKTAEQHFIFDNLSEDCVPSILRGFSAPVIIQNESITDQDLLHLMRYDTDEFNRYDAGQSISQKLINHIYHAQDYDHLLPNYLAAIQDTVLDQSLDCAFKAYSCAVPSLNYMIQKNEHVDPKKMLLARKSLQTMIAQNLASIFQQCYDANVIKEPFAPTTEQAGKRQLKNLALGYLIKAEKIDDMTLRGYYEAADNMTDKIAILGHLSEVGNDLYHELMQNFYGEYAQNPLVIDKWFALQARAVADNVLETVSELLGHEAFTFKNPNRARALVGVFLHANPAYFHSVSGYEFGKEQILTLDKLNPKTAARMATAFENVTFMSHDIQKSAKEVLSDILSDKSQISNDLYEITSKIYHSL